MKVIANLLYSSVLLLILDTTKDNGHIPDEILKEIYNLKTLVVLKKKLDSVQC